ncbi:MAG: PQQ-like beta-propeller repeat protein [Deltaproteobacteria bacterium]|nr:PQQ-like beta-propeller repeat protein [Deltaproteobacteria bacterium]
MLTRSAKTVLGFLAVGVLSALAAACTDRVVQSFGAVDSSTDSEFAGAADSGPNGPIDAASNGEWTGEADAGFDTGGGPDAVCPAHGEDLESYRGYDCDAKEVFGCGPPDFGPCDCPWTSCQFKLDICGRQETWGCGCYSKKDFPGPWGTEYASAWRCGRSSAYYEWCDTSCPYGLEKFGPVQGVVSFPRSGAFLFVTQPGELFLYGAIFGDRAWHYQLPSETRTSATFQKHEVEVAYLGAMDGYLYAVARPKRPNGLGLWMNDNGLLQWKFQTGGAIESSAAIASDGTIYFGSADGNIYALGADGSRKWSYPTGGAVNSSPAIGADGTVYVGSNDKKLYAIAPDGSLKWVVETGGAVHSSPAIDSDGTICFGSADRKVYSVSAEGTVMWTFETEGEVLSSPAIDIDGIVYIGSNDAKLYALAKDGTLKWSYQAAPEPFTLPDFYTAPAISDRGYIFVGRRDGYLLRFVRGGAGIGGEKICSEITGHPSISSWEARHNSGDGSFVIGCNEGIYGYGRGGALEWEEYGVLSKSAPWPKFRHDDWNTGNISTK